jgi:hypothetical protein
MISLFGDTEGEEVLFSWGEVDCGLIGPLRLDVKATNDIGRAVRVPALS